MRGRPARAARTPPELCVLTQRPERWPKAHCRAKTRNAPDFSLQLSLALLAVEGPEHIPPDAKRGRCCHRPRLRFRPGSLDPGRFPIGFCRSKLLQDPIRDSSKQASRYPFEYPRGKPRFHPFGRLPGKPATILEHPSGKPAIVRFRLFSTGRTRFPDRPFLSGQALRFPSGLPSSKLSGRPFAIPLPEGSGLAGLRKSGFGLEFPRCLALLPGCPTRASLASFPKDIGPLGTGGVWSFFPVAGWSLLTARGQTDSVSRVAPSRILAVQPVDNVDNVDNSPESGNHRPAVSPPAPADASGRSPRHGRVGRIHRPRGPRPSPPPTSARRSARARTPPSDNPRRARPP